MNVVIFMPPVFGSIREKVLFQALYMSLIGKKLVTVPDHMAGAVKLTWLMSFPKIANRERFYASVQYGQF